MITTPALSAQSKEQISRDQFRERLHRYGWKPVDIHEDDGEDFNVEVYIDGRHTGVNFYVQLKSGFDLSEAPRTGFVPCQVDVPHLLRWAEFPTPVVLVVWDIRRREGRWVLVADALRDLDARDGKWRSGKARTVRVPWSQAADDGGLQDLRRTVGQVMFPLLARGRGLATEFTVHYPDIDGDVAALSLAETDAIARTGRFTRSSERGTVNVRTSDPREILRLGTPGAAIQLENRWGCDQRAVVGAPIPLGSALRRVRGVVESMCLKRVATDREPALVDVAVREIHEDWFYPDVMIGEARRLSSRLVALFGAKQVYLFGSLAWPDHRIINGDIDLAVDGLPLERFLDAVAWLSRATSFDVDLVQLESLPEPLRSRIIAEGDVLSAS